VDALGSLVCLSKVSPDKRIAQLLMLTQAKNVQDSDQFTFALGLPVPLLNGFGCLLFFIQLMI